MPFRNPVYPHSFPDPFVLKYREEYWAYSTGFQPDGNLFGILHSIDLVNWTWVGSAMSPLPGDFPCYWAPEVTIEQDGSFLMYYSVGNEELMTIRVARASAPSGPFIDCGVQLTSEPFAIDAHVFIDDDGSRYLFYATDFLEAPHMGTGTVRDKMLDALHLEHKPSPVARAKFDWQVYDPNRASKGNVRWYTVEGPFVLKRKWLYYMMFSGGNWQNISYGVSYAATRNISSNEEWQQSADGIKLLPILRTIAGKVIGPGHNSVIRGPDNRQLYCVYHEWVNGERVMAIDPLEFVGERLVVIGPSFEDASSPIAARRLTLWDQHVTGAETKMHSGDNHMLQLSGPSSLLEFSVFLADGAALQIEFSKALGFASSITIGPGSQTIPNVWQHVRLELDGTLFRWWLGNRKIQEGIIPRPTREIEFKANGGQVLVSAIEFTRGWEDNFDGYPGNNDLIECGWDPDDEGYWEITESRELQCSKIRGDESRMTKSLRGIRNFEFVVNLRLGAGADKEYAGVSLLLGSEILFAAGLRASEGTAECCVTQDDNTITISKLNPEEVTDYQQIRIRFNDGEINVRFANTSYNSSIEFLPDAVALRTNCGGRFDMCRLTEIPA